MTTTMVMMLLLTMMMMMTTVLLKVLTVKWHSQVKTVFSRLRQLSSSSSSPRLWSSRQ
jgi:hypothetical protein